MLRRIIGEDVSLEVRYSPQRLAVLADVGMMEQVLLNLAVNARDAMPTGGELVISTELVQPDPARRPPGPPDAVAEYARLSVRDTGCGIAAENLTRIFDPFFTTKEVGKGTGLGLATVHGIAQQHQGFVEVESQLQAGTTFHLYLPVESRDAGSAAEKPVPIAVRGGPETVLLVEDEQAVRLLARQILEHYGYRVLEADSGQAALPLWQQHRAEIDLLLTDMIMPGGLTGHQLAAQLRAEKPSLRVLFSSGYSQDMLKPDAQHPGASSFLQKPYPPQTLAKAVRDCLDGTPA
jgi:CheY-like chemotaxis protein